MTKFTRSNTGKYIVQGKTYEQLIGSRAQVHHGTAYKTSGGLTHSDLIQNKQGRIVSKRKHSSAKRENRLAKAGFLTKKGVFGFFRKSSKSKSKARTRTRSRSRSRSRSRRGGAPYGNSLSPHSFDGKGVGTSGVDLQFIAGNAG